jgi:hypothetical protein
MDSKTAFVAETCFWFSLKAANSILCHVSEACTFSWSKEVPRREQKALNETTTANNLTTKAPIQRAEQSDVSQP